MTRTLSAALALLVAFTLSLTLTAVPARATENTWDYAVRVSSSVQASPAKVTLTWPQDTNGVPASYTVFRKSPDATSWGAGTTLSGSTTSYTDTAVSSGNVYEYRIVKAAGSYTGYGYIQVGVAAPLVDVRGKVVLVVDSSVASPVSSELARLQQDLAGDGWIVVRRDVGRNDSPVTVRAAIKSVYDSDPANVKAVFLFGHVPVPYSGQLNPDGHPDHVGAWPADAYYGDMDGSWTDSSVNYTQTINTDANDARRMSNIPGDGKFDQTTLPSAVELQVGRVDLANMPGRTSWNGPATFPSEIELLRKYLNKDHHFRHRVTNPARRAVLGDYFGTRGGEAFAASGFRSFAPLVGANNIRNLNTEFSDQKGVWIQQVAQNDYLLAYGCGAGSYSSIAGLGNTGLYNDGTTVELVNANVRGVFNLLFGSWLGDWDHDDNMLRAPLATDHGLVSVWSGRPHWFLHPLGAGETIGYAARLAMNNSGLYQTQINSSANRIHIALMGDPTLRLHPVVPVGNLNGSANGGTVALTWSASSDSAIVGYHVYRGSATSGFTRLTSTPVTATNFSDSNGSSGATYMVRAIKLEDTPSGSYYNASQGQFWTASGTSGGGVIATPLPPVDVTAPTVAFTSPASGASLSGSTTIAASASDNVGIAGVQFKLNGANLGAELTAAPFSTTLDTTSLANGSHTLTAVARDAAGNSATANAITFNVSNTVAGGGGSAPSGTPAVSIAATDANAVIGSATDTATVTFTRSGSTGSALTVNYTLGGTAGKWDDYRRIPEGDMPVSIVIPAGSSSASMTIVATSSAREGSTASFTLAPSSAYTISGNATATLAFSFIPSTSSTVATTTSTTTTPTTSPPTNSTLTSTTPTPTSDVSVVTASVVATVPTALIGSTTDVAVLTFSRTGSTAADLLINYTLSGTAGKWDHYRRDLGDMPVSVTIPAGAASTTMKILGISGAPSGSTAIFTLASGTGYTVGSPASATLTLTDTAAATIPTVGVIASDAIAAPGSSADTALLTFSRSGSTALPLTVNYTLGGTAGKWDDYRRDLGDMPVSITIPAGAVSATMKILATVNAKEGSTATFTLAADSAYKIGTASSATLTFTSSGLLPQTPTTPTTPTTDSGSGTVINPITVTPEPPSTSTPPPTSPTTATTDTTWFDDQLPLGASGTARGGDTWNWVSSSPAPFSGKVSHRSAIKSGLHEHTFNWATQTLSVAAGDTMFVYIYIDPDNKPSEVMVSWCTTNWEHRAYWGANLIAYGTNNTVGRRYMGPLPAAGQWVRLEVPASAVGLEGRTVVGMGFHLHGGRASWDKTGKSTTTTTTPPPPPPPDSGSGMPTVTIAATDATAVVGDSTNTALLTFSRTGSTSSALTVNYSLGGTAAKWDDYRRIPEGDMPASVTIPVGASSTTMTIGAVGIASGASTATAVFTLSSSSAYTVGSPNSATLTLSTSGTTTPTAPPPTTQPPPTDTGTPTVTIAATDATAVVGDSTNTALLTFSRTGSTSSALTVNYTLGGTAGKWDDYRRIPEGDMPVSVTIPAGASSTTMKIGAYGIASGASSATAIFTLSSSSAYTVGSPGSATLTLSTSGTTTPTTPPPTTQPPPTTPTTPPPVVTNPDTPITPSPATIENAALRIPVVGEHQLRVLTPTTLELQRITGSAADWNLVSSGTFNAPALTQFAVTVNGQSVGVTAVGFRRRVAYGTLNTRDLRVDNGLSLTLASPVPEGATVEVKNPSGTVFPASLQFKATADATRYSPAIHVNQEGYVPSFPKKAMIGYYLGNRGELDVDASAGFKLINAKTGAVVHTGTLTLRKDVGYSTTPLPYQKVLQADFSSFTTPGEYQLVVPGLGASLPFLINDGVAMAFHRTYAMGLFHQRCGVECALPFTRFTHAPCHTGPAEIPSGAGYDFTWSVIASETSGAKNNTRHTAPQMVSEATMLYPFVNKGKIDVSGGHHDAGDYSKYTTNVAHLVHQLAFIADSIGGARALDNLGLPNSGDGISDILQEAKHESDFLAKLQDADGGFYFLVYPKDRRYEYDAIPGVPIQQVVWPKTTSATAASVAALAQMASSPTFKAAYPAEAAAYLNKAKLGWQFLTNAIAKYGKNGAYQKITHYGDEFMHDDELAWAACEMFLATGEAVYAQKLQEWFPNPADQSTFRWSWGRLFEGYGNAIRSYAFAARSGRLPGSALNASYLAACENQIKLAGDDQTRWSKESAYGSSFPDHTKRIVNAGWYFSLDAASDIAAAYQLNPNPDYIEALVANMNYEGGANPVNTTFITGLGLKRQREVVNQWALNDHRVLPPIGYPSGNIVGGYSWLGTYGSELNDLCFPRTDSAGGGYALQDRYSDIWNVTAELVTVNQARALAALSVLANQTAAKSTPWKPTASAKILASATSVAVGQSVTLSLDPALNVAGARITWEARDQQPDFGATYTIKPKNTGAQWVEVEVTFPDGRRVFGTATFTAQ